MMAEFGLYLLDSKVVLWGAFIGFLVMSIFTIAWEATR